MAAFNCRLNNWPSFLLLGIGFILVFLTGSLQASIVVHDYSFPPPQVRVVGEYHRVEMAGLVSLGKPGEPVLPVRVAKLLLPYGEEVEAIEVILGQRVAIEGSYIVEPGQAPLPLSFQGPYNPVSPREEIYSSPRAYPGRDYRLVTVQSLSGYRIAFVNLYPVEYIPSQGRLYWYRSLQLRVVTAPSSEARLSSRRMLKRSASILRRVEVLVDNPKEMSSYQGAEGYIPSYSSLVAPTYDYDYVIITNGELSSYFQPLADFHTARGIRAGIFLVEDIYAGYEGSDNQEKIRNFIIDAWHNWEIEWVLLGGDDEIVPHRSLYSEAAGEVDYDIASDLYYGGLDGDWNPDGDDRWGEPGEDDLLAEVWVGRMAVDSGQEAQNFIAKLISYQASPAAGDCVKGLMAGEDLGWEVWGKDYKEEIREGSSNWGYTTVSFPDWFEVGTLYDKDSPWGKDDLIWLMNSGQHLINHLGHANVTYAMKMNNSDVDNSLTNDGINEGYFIIYTQGCYCNAFDNRTPEGGYTEDAISEHFTRVENGAVAFMGNTRYGWGCYSTTDGPSQHYDRQFFDALFGEGLTKIGRAFQDSKEENIGYIDGECMRWCYYQLCLLGDPAMDIWTEIPGELTVNYEGVVQVGLRPFEVLVEIAGEPVERALVCVTKGDEVYEHGLTGPDGRVTLDICPLTPGVMEVVITAHNGLPHQGEVTVIPPSGPYVAYYSYIVDDSLGGNGDGVVNPGEEIGLPMVLKNYGIETSYGVSATLSCEDTMVTVISSASSYGDIPPDSLAMGDQPYIFRMSSNCSDNYPVSFDLEISDDSLNLWTFHPSIVVYAPVLSYFSYLVDDSLGGDNDHIPEPGEEVNLILTLQNRGGANANSVIGILSTGDLHITLTSDSSYFGTIESKSKGDNCLSPFVFSVSSSCPRGHPVLFDFRFIAAGGYFGEDTFKVVISPIIPIFSDITDQAGVGGNEVSYGVALADIDMDGDLDVYVNNINGFNNLCRNDGGNTFTDIASSAGVADVRVGRAAIFGDIDNDGDLDMFIAMGDTSDLLFRNDGNSHFTDITASAGVGSGKGWSAAFGDVDNDGFLDLYVTTYHGPNILYHNNGNNTFTDVTSSAGVEGHGRCYGVAFGDVDNDGDLDLYVVHANRISNALFENDGAGVFTDITDEAGVQGGYGGTGAVFGDIDNDGDLDLFVAQGYSSPDILYENDGSGHFTDITRAAGVGDYGYSLSAQFGDVDNDEDLDLYISNFGRNTLYVNNGDMTFVDLSDIAGVDCPGSFSLGTVFGDLDNDGDLDIYVSNFGDNQEQKNYLFSNRIDYNGYIKIRLKGRITNRAGIGAKVKIYDSGHFGNPEFLRGFREISGGSGYCSMSSLICHFGVELGGNFDVEVIWPTSGIVDTFHSVNAGAFYIAIEGSSLVGLRENRPTTRPKAFSLSQNNPNPFNPFTKITYSLPKDCEVRLNIYNVLGKRVKVLVNERKKAGYYCVFWDGRNERGKQVSSGIYFSRMEAGNFKSTKKMVLIR